MLAEKVNESERERERVDFHKELLGSVDGLANVSTWKEVFPLAYICTYGSILYMYT